MLGCGEATASCRPRCGVRPCAGAGRGSARRRAGSLSSTSTAWANSRSLTLACSSGAASARCSSSGSVPAAARVDVRRAEALAHQAREQQPLLVGRAGRRPAPRWPRRTAAAPRPPRSSARSQETGRSCAAVAHQRARDALVDVEGLVGEAALVAQPAVVDLGCSRAEHAQRALVADGERDVALGRAQRADRAGALDVPRPRAEAVGARGQRARPGTARRCCRLNGRDVGVPVEGRDVGVRPRARAAPAGSPRRPPGRSARSGSRGCSARGRSRSAARAPAA